MSYNGHKNYNHWNVSLWLGNDEGLYNLVKREIRRADNLDDAAGEILRQLPEETPDEVPYTFTTVRAAIRGGYKVW